MKSFLSVSSLFLCAAISSPAFSEDQPSQDNPLVSRFEGAAMHAYRASDYDAVALPKGPIPSAPKTGAWNWC